MGPACSEEADAPQARPLAACRRGRDEPLQAMPEERIEASDGGTASVFDIATYLRAGHAMAPELDALYRLWDAKRTVYAMPSRGDFLFEELVPWLGHLMLVDAIDGGRDFVYRVFGTGIAEFLGQDLTGKRLSTLPPQLQRPLGDEYCGVMAARRAHYVVGSPFLSRPFTIAARAILPLSRAGRAVDQLLIGFYQLTSRV